MVCSLLKHRRITTTLAKAKAARSVAEKMITLGKAGTLHDRRLAAARLHQDAKAVKILFDEIAPTQKERHGGYTRIVRLGGRQAQRQGDAAKMVILEFVDVPVREEPAPAAKTGAEEKKSGQDAKPAEGKKEKPAAAVPA